MRTLQHSDVIAMFDRVGEILHRTSAIDQDGNSAAISWLLIDCRPPSDGPCVYLWVAEYPDGKRTILYIGKTGASLVLRCRHHSQGFMRGGRGKAHAAELIALIGAGIKIGVYGLWPEPLDWRGQVIPAHSSIEDWLLTVTKPRPIRNVGPKD